MTGCTTHVSSWDTPIRRAACILVHRHGRAAPVRADIRYRLLAAQGSTAAPLWRELRDYLARTQHDPVRWRELRDCAYPDAVTWLSGSHNGPVVTDDRMAARGAV